MNDDDPPPYIEGQLDLIEELEETNGPVQDVQ